MNAERKAKLEAAKAKLVEARVIIIGLKDEANEFYNSIDSEHPDYDQVSDDLDNLIFAYDGVDEAIDYLDASIGEESSDDVEDTDDIHYSLTI